MKTIKKTLSAFFCSIICVSVGISFADEKTIAQLQTELVSPWLVTVEGESRTRTLRIKGVEQRTPETFLLDAEYGWSDERQIKIAPEVSQNAQERKLVFTTGADSKIVTTQAADGTFVGTFTLKSGTTKAISIARIAEDELKAKVANAKADRMAAIVVKPGADVPASCALFSGRWTGTWSWGVGQQWLWVASVDAKCMAKIAYLGSDRMPTGFDTVEIKDGVLAWLCNRSTGGTCVLKLDGDELKATYSNPSGGRNGAVFTRIQ